MATKRNCGVRMIDGVEVRFNDRRLVQWMSDWCRADELARAGHLTRRHYPGLYGHVDYFVAD